MIDVDVEVVCWGYVLVDGVEEFFVELFFFFVVGMGLF